MNRPTILTTINYYLPGFRAGGPLQALANAVEWLGDEFCFRIITQDRDAGVDQPYAGCTPGIWTTVGKAEVMYLAPQQQGLRQWRRLIHSTPHDFLYLNSFFAPSFTIRPLMVRRFAGRYSAPVLLEPRGEFGPDAIRHRSGKKRLYLAAAGRSGLLNGVSFLATTDTEAADIRRELPHARVFVAPNLPPAIQAAAEMPPCRAKSNGELKILFLSRIHPIKNPEAAVRAVGELNGNVQLHVYGPIEDESLWRRCQAAASRWPPSRRLFYHGPLAKEFVTGVMQTHDVLLLPTLGENFGYVILEALMAGLPVVISDRTPWRGLSERGVGWDLPLEQPHRFAATLQQLVEMPTADFHALRARAWSYGRAQSDRSSEGIAQVRDVFGRLLYDVRTAA
jgi:glycosyltransferase involved in cell wall biosynthesis